MQLFALFLFPLLSRAQLPSVSGFPHLTVGNVSADNALVKLGRPIEGASLELGMSGMLLHTDYMKVQDVARDATEEE